MLNAQGASSPNPQISNCLWMNTGVQLHTIFSSESRSWKQLVSTTRTDYLYNLELKVILSSRGRKISEIVELY